MMTDQYSTDSTPTAECPSPPRLANEPISFEPLPRDLGAEMPHLGRQSWLQIYLCAALFVNFAFLFFNGHGGDMGFWENWVKQLGENGYANFHGDYPPVFLHWLYLVGKAVAFAGVPVEANDFLKFLVQLPIVSSHCLLVCIIYSLLSQSPTSNAKFHFILALTVFNPALLFDGPMWGQVDLLPSTIALSAVLLCFSERWSIAAVPLYMLALLTKFQMICFAPVFAIAFFSRPFAHLLGIAISVAVFALTFLPFIVTGHFVQAFKQAYINTLGQYPVSTYNAANLWMLVTGNSAPDSTLVLPLAPDSALGKLATAKHVGMIAFALFCIGIFIQGVHRLISQHYARTPVAFKIYGVQTAMFCALAFFTLLPAMHERYLFPAVIFSLAYVAIAGAKFIYPLALSMLCALNMAVILGINGSDIWQGLSILMVIIFSLAIIEILFGRRGYYYVSKTSLAAAKTPALFLWVVVATTSAMFFYLQNRYQIHQPDIAERDILMTKVAPSHAQQDHGTLRVNRSFDNKILSVGGKRYAEGFGTHSNSQINFHLPDNAAEFSFIVGLDDEIGSAEVIFSIWGDNRKLWESPVIYGFERNQKANRVDVRGVKNLQLRVDSNGPDEWDHADWINPVLHLGEPAAAVETSSAEVVE